MKKNTVLPVILAFLAACTNPVLKWIDTPGDIITNSGSGTGPLTPSASDKAITTFSFGIEGEEISIRAEPDQDGTIPIKAVLPVNTGITGLSPSITWIGASITPPDGTVRTARPYADSSRNFTNPLVYTVRAGDGTTQIYTVQVYVKTAQSAEIIWCDVELGGGRMAEGVVNQPAAGGTGEIIIRVPSGTNTANLTAKIAQTGKSLSAPNAVGTQNLSGTAISLRGNFSVTSPADDRTYTVTAEDGSKKKYEVTVIVDKSTVKEITAFSFVGLENDEYVIIGAEPRADGVYPIVATVPGSEEVSSLTPAVNYKGAGITGAGISVSRTANFDDDSSPVTANPAHQDFSAPVSYRVTAEDTTFRDYEVTVYRSDLNSKQITGFYFPFLNNAQGTQGPAGIINETAKTIAITVPAGTNLSALAPAVYHTGASISPLSGAPKNFSNSIAVPVIYTVTARNGSTQDYKVSVFVAKRSDKAITAFDFSNVSGETTVIGGTPGADGIPIVVTVPYNTTVTGLIPVVTHTGASITGGGIPAGGLGTVTGSPSNFSGPVTYTVKAEDGTTQNYSVTVIKTADPTLLATSTLASIDGFYFNNPNAVGVIDQSNKTIAVTVPYGTDRANLIPTIYFTGNIVVKGAVADTSHSPNTGPPLTPYMSSPAGFEATDFTSSVDYTVTALNNSDFKTYTVTVTVGDAPTPPPPSDVREITFFSFFEVTDTDTRPFISLMPDASGKYPVEVVVPDTTDLTILRPVILYKGASIAGAGNLSAGTPAPYDPEILGTAAANPVDFSSSTTTPIIYTVTAESGATSQYAVKVKTDDNNKKEITDFYFTSPVAVGIINQAAKTITVTVPNGTNLSSLTPSVSYTGVSLDPASGRTVNFSSPVTYTVSARNGTAQPYTVTVIPKPSAAKEITAVSLPGAGVLETVIGAVPGSDGYIPISITVSEQTNIGALRPTISHTGVSITPPGGTPQTAKPFIDGTRDFSIPQAYRVTAEDGSYKDYAVSVHVSGGGAKVITGFVFKSVPLGSGTVTVVGQIDQDTHTIEVKVPHAVTALTSLAPTITYLGRSLGYSNTSEEIPAEVDTNTGPAGQSDTFLDTSRNFTANRYYTVTAADTSTLKYTVKVVKIPEVTINYEGPVDDKFTTESFDQNTGLLTITILNTKQFPLSAPTYTYGSPYDWYVDSVDQPVSTTQNTLVIKTADFPPGRHQVTVLAKRSSDGKHYSNTLYFLVQE